MKKKITDDHIVNTIIGEGAEFSGEFRLSGVIRIDGTFRGVIETDGKVLIGKTGFVDTDIKAKVIVAGGKVRGNLYATEKVELLESCDIEGDIITPALQMEEGVQFRGKCTVNKAV